MRRKMLAVLFLVPLLAGMVAAQDLAGKTGFGLRASSFSIRRFVTNNFGIDLGIDYLSRTLTTDPADSNRSNYSVGGFWVKEIFPNTLLEVGATLQGWQGSDAGTFFSALAINPFIGAECFINDHVSIDGKIFLGAYGSQIVGATRSTSLSILSGNLGAHIYF